MKTQKPICPKCNSAMIYVRLNGEIVCRRCGSVSRSTSIPKNSTVDSGKSIPNLITPPNNEGMDADQIKELDEEVKKVQNDN